MVKTYKELLVWQKGMNLVSQVYSATAGFPKSETYGLTDQMRRAAVSIPSNIAEGFGRNSRIELAHFSQYSLASLYELETQVIIAKNQDYLPQITFEGLSALINELNAMLQSFGFNLRHPKSSKTKPKTTK